MVPHHTMVRTIGRGSYGEIWLARSLTGAWRAVKIVDRRRFEDERSFEREFAGMASFEPVSREHEGFVDILHVGRSDDDAFFYYVMELADDVVPRSPFDPEVYQPKTLKSELARVGRMSADQVIALGLSLTDALAELHGHALVHRDIKPANIIFCGGAPKVADIGLVSAMGQASFVGTEGYVPPEGPGNEQSDIYSLGKVLYEIGMGKDRMQFPEMNTGLADFPDRELLLRLNDVLLRACAHSQTERYATAREMREDLLRARDGRPLAGRPRNRRRWLIAAALLAILSMVAYALMPVGKGSVFIEVEPPEAMVVFQDKPLHSPIDLKDIPAGIHRIRIGSSEYENIDTTITIKADEVARPPKFILQRALRSLSIESEPAGLAFELKAGETLIQSGTAPATVPELRVGEYTLSMSHEGRNKTLAVQLEKEGTPPAKIIFGSKKYLITSVPKGAEILCDGRFIGTANCEVDLMEGPHNLVARYKTWPDDLRPIKAEPGGEPGAIAFAFLPGSVKLASSPKGAIVYKDGVRFGSAPGQIDNLEPGEITLVFKLASYTDVAVPVTVRPGGIAIAEGEFDKRPGPRSGAPWTNGLGMKFVPVGELLVAIWPTRVADYSAYEIAAGVPPRLADFTQTPDHPVINVNSDDAREFCKWLTASERKAGRLDEKQTYRLPTDAEWSAVVGIPDEGGNTPEQRDGKYRQYLWGNAWPPPANSGNFADASTKKNAGIPGYLDGWQQTSPVGSFPATGGGLFDMTGNVWQWVADSYRGPQARKTWGVLRGGSWGTSQQNELQLGYRDVVDPKERDPLFGFRCVIEMGN